MGWNYTMSITGGGGTEKRMDSLERRVAKRLGWTWDNLRSRVESVTDHKGDLTVEWRIVPTGAEMDAWNLGWEDEGEDSGNVRHDWPGRRH